LLIWLLVIFNAGIALAYFVIPIALLAYLKLGRSSTITYLFAVFIFGCGTTHVMQVVTMYIGGLNYWIEMLVCGATFIASACTAMVLLTQGPRIKLWTREVIRD
jgi:hypothetical protein